MNPWCRLILPLILLLSACSNRVGESGPFVLPPDLVGTWTSATGPHGLRDFTVKISDDATFERLLPITAGRPVIFGRLTSFKWAVANRRTFRMEPLNGAVDSSVAAMLVTIESVDPDTLKLHFQTEHAKLETRGTLTAPGIAVALPFPQSTTHGDAFVTVRRLPEARLPALRNEYAASETAAREDALRRAERAARVARMKSEGRRVVRGYWLAEKVEHRSSTTGALLREDDVTKLFVDEKMLWKEAPWSFRVFEFPLPLAWMSNTATRPKFEPFSIADDKRFTVGKQDTFSILGRAPQRMFCYMDSAAGEFMVWNLKWSLTPPALPEPVTIEPPFDETLVPADKAPAKLIEAVVNAVKEDTWYLQRMDRVTPSRHRIAGVEYHPGLQKSDPKMVPGLLPIELKITGKQISVNSRVSTPLEVKHSTMGPSFLSFTVPVGPYTGEVQTLILMNKAPALRLAIKLEPGGDYVLLTYDKTKKTKDDPEARKNLDLANLIRARTLLSAETSAAADLGALRQQMTQWRARPTVPVSVPWSVAVILGLDPVNVLTRTFDQVEPLESQFQYLSWDEAREFKLSIETALRAP